MVGVGVGWWRGNDRINVGLPVLFRKKGVGGEPENWNLDVLHLMLRDKCEVKLLMAFVLRGRRRGRGMAEIRQGDGNRMENGLLGLMYVKNKHYAQGWSEDWKVGWKIALCYEGGSRGLRVDWRKEMIGFPLPSRWVLLTESSQWVQLGLGWGQIWVPAGPESSAPKRRAKPWLGGA